MKKYLLYARVACKYQESESGLEQQIVSIKKFARDNKLVIGGIFKESGCSRASLGEIAVRLRNDQLSGIICTGADRLSRNYIENYSILDLLRKKGFEVITLATSSVEKFLSAMMESFLQYERDLRSERIKRGLAAKKQRTS